MTDTHREDVVDVDQARLMIAEAEARVVDIRDAEEFADYRIPGSGNHPDPASESLAAELADIERVLVVCADGTRSSEVAAQLREHEVDAIRLEGGVEAWRSKRLPMQPSPDVEQGEAEPPKLPGAGV
jgi:rhodanese-related sulfurtransferase